MSDNVYNVDLPEPLPDDEIVVDKEQFRYIVYENDNGNEVPKTEYELEKAPVIRIDTVTGRANGQDVTFTQGTDYDLTADKERIEWLDGGRRPDEGAPFYVTYTATSILSRFNEAAEEEIVSLDTTLEQISDSKFIETAEGDELDQIGRIFGEELGKRRGRDDKTYRLYLKSVVQSVISRGTVPDIKEAVSAATGIPVEEITLNEDFTNVEYDLILNPTSPLRGSTIEDIAGVADPSGVRLDKISYLIDSEEMAVEDSISITEGVQVDTDEMGADDSVQIDANKVTASDTFGADDAVGIDTNVVTATDTLGVQDTVNSDTRDKNTARWEATGDEVDWDFFEWTELIDLTRTLSDELGADDAVAIDTNKVSAADTLGADDSVVIDPNVTTASDTFGADDGVTFTTTTVSWADSSGTGGSWESIEWTKQHN